MGVVMPVIRVRPLAALREAIGADEIKFEVEEGASPIDVVRKLVENYGDDVESLLIDDKHNKVRPQILIFLNGKSVQHSKLSTIKLSDGDELSIIPPVAGG